MGKLWANGHIVYRDFFDHKGPLIFLIDAIGYSFEDSRMGLFLVQTIFFTIGLSFNWFMIRKNIKKSWSILILINILAFWAITINEGNMTEEYSNLFLSIATYFQIKYYLNYKKEALDSLSGGGIFYNIIL